MTKKYDDVADELTGKVKLKISPLDGTFACNHCVYAKNGLAQAPCNDGNISNKCVDVWKLNPNKNVYWVNC